MNCKLLIILIMGFSILSCEKKDLEKPIIDEAYFKVMDIEEPYRNLVYDKESKLIYLISRKENGKMFAYNYSEFSITAKGAIDDFHIIDYPVVLGEYNGNKELIIGGLKFICIYDAKTLNFKEKFRVFDDSLLQFISSVDFRPPNLIFIGACNTSEIDGDNGALVYNRTTGQQIVRSPYGDQCQRIKTFIKDPSTGEIGLFSLGFQTSHSLMAFDVFSSSGESLNSIIKIPSNGLSPSILATNEHVDYFITNNIGAIYNKSDGTFIGNLDDEYYYNFFLNDDGSRIYALLNPSTINVFDYPSLEFLGTITPSEKSIKRNYEPTTGFIEDDKMILVYFSYKDVYLSIIDLPDF